MENRESSLRPQKSSGFSTALLLLTVTLVALCLPVLFLFLCMCYFFVAAAPPTSERVRARVSFLG